MLVSKAQYRNHFREWAWTEFWSPFFKYFTLIDSVLFTWSGKSLELKGQSSRFYPHMSAFHHPFLGDSQQGLTKEHKARQWAFRAIILNGEEYNLSYWGTITMETCWGTQWGTQRDSNSPSDKWMPPLRMAFPARLCSQHLLRSTRWLQLCLPGLPSFETFL